MLMGSTGATAAEKNADDKSNPVYKLNPAVDLPVFFVAGFAAVGWTLGDELGPAHCAPLCDKGAVNTMDRHVAGYFSERWARISDAALLGLLGLGVTALFADEGFTSGIVDLVVVAESVLIANSAIILLNLTTRRPRPYLYSDSAPEDVRSSGTAQLSFPSGHVGAATAMTTTMFGVLYLRHPDSPWPWVWLGVGIAASGLVATGRVMAGRHFISDVLVGGAIGVCIGILVPALHKRRLIVTPTVLDDSAAGLSFVGVF